MTTTSALQTKPDYYSSSEECIASTRIRTQTNPRYRGFNQTQFTAGDEEQFQKYRYHVNGNVCIPNISMDDNIFKDISSTLWSGYNNLEATVVLDTFRYMFNKFKKGIFVKILDNKLRVFLPFSKAKFVNEWGDKIKFDPNKYSNMTEFLRHVSNLSGHRFFPNRVNSQTNQWYANNCLVRYEFPLSEGESNVSNVKNMLEELCATRKVPDIEFFINRRDFPLITKDYTEPYNNIWDSEHTPLVSYSYPKYSPIFSMSKTDRYADVLSPTWEDWARIQSHENKWFPKSCRDYKHTFNIPWEDKIPTAVFRGQTTGCGITIATNPRLNVSYISAITPPDSEGIPYLNAGVTKWNVRPRKLQGYPYLSTLDVKSLPFYLVDPLTPEQQSGYKYIINIEGHVSAFRLSLELSMGSVILLVDSMWKIWYSDMLIPYEHYVPVRSDLSNLIDQIKWCRNHDDECKKIAENAHKFYNTYLQKKGVLDYMQKKLVDLKNAMGIYLYNFSTPLDLQIAQEDHALNELKYPPTTKGIEDISKIPNIGRSYGLLQGIEWIVHMVIDKSNFEEVAEERSIIFKNKLGTVKEFALAGYKFAVKSTSDIQKSKEHIHDTYVGTRSINEVIKHVPNFAYVFGRFYNGDTVNVVTEFIHGITLHEYIKSPAFQFDEFLFILLQICLALQVAQDHCGLVHYDLTPWNIVIQRVAERKEDGPTFDYVIDHNKVYRVRSHLIPVIIDYGKSHVIHGDEHHGFINMYRTSTIQDVITLLITSVNQISNDKRLPSREFSDLLRLMNFLSGSKYREKTFQSSKDLKSFLSKTSIYSELISSDKFELENKRPMDFIRYIHRALRSYKFPLGLVKNYKPSMNKGNSRQVFEYILCSQNIDRAKTYMNVFVRLKHCSLPQPNNLFFVYYVAQTLSDNLSSVNAEMLSFLKKVNINPKEYSDVYQSTVDFLHNLYQKKIDNMNETDVDYAISKEFSQLVQAPYNENTFLVPKSVFKLIQPYRDDDLSDYKEIITFILLNTGKYQLADKDRYHYIKNFSQLLSTSSLVMKNNSANVKTLIVVAERIYSLDKKVLTLELENIKDENCSDTTRYLEQYEEILEKVRLSYL